MLNDHSSTPKATDFIWKAAKWYQKLRQMCEVLCALLDAASAEYQLQPDAPPPEAGSQPPQPADSMARHWLRRPD